MSYVNLSGLYFATNKFDKCVECCHKAIQVANKFLRGSPQIINVAKNNIR